MHGRLLHCVLQHVYYKLINNWFTTYNSDGRKIVAFHMLNWHTECLFRSNRDRRHMGWIVQRSCYWRKDGKSHMDFISSSTAYAQISVGNDRQIKYIMNYTTERNQPRPYYQSRVVNNSCSTQNRLRSFVENVFILFADVDPGISI